MVGVRAGEVIIDFGTTGPWQWVAFSPAQALHFAEILIKTAALATEAQIH